MKKILAWRFTLNQQNGKYDMFEEQDKLGNWIKVGELNSFKDLI